ncbi:hypothetical protein A7U60_g8326 [Sanghuangporus baumii]|uniref:HMG box domain-containing protein n=1 Tax=Sanghuangporus baumii TaxID=108892 RepID=A0A9Q5HRW7_SANBA|nr:hypothetical protein A7U60_g8326 [Sanghuangporus baumii]
MPASRPPVRAAQTSYQSIANIDPKSSEAQLAYTRVYNVDPAPPPPPTRKRRAPNAFIVFRSFLIANRFIPPDITHQKDVSCYVAEKWRGMSASRRSEFFKLAEIERQRLETEPPSELAREGTARRRRSSMQQGVDVQSSSTGIPASSLYVFPSEVYAEGIPSADFDSPTPGIPSSNAGQLVSGSPAAPQPVLAIPPNLLQWDHEQSSDPSGSNALTAHEFGSSPAYTLWPSVHGHDFGCSGVGSDVVQPDLAFTYGTDASWQAHLALDGPLPFPYDCFFDPNSFEFYA